MSILFDNIQGLLIAIPLFFGCLQLLFNNNSLNIIFGLIVGGLGVIISILGLYGYHIDLVNKSYYFAGLSNGNGVEFIYTHSEGMIILSLFLIYLNTVYFSFRNKISSFHLNIPFVSLLLMCLIGLTMVNDMFTTYIFFEVTGACLYILFAYRHKIINYKRTFDYLIISGISGSFFLIGVCAIYSQTGHLNLSMININPDESYFLSIVGYLLMMLSFFIKVGIYPFARLLYQLYSNVNFTIMSIVFATSKVFLFVLYKIGYSCFSFLLTKDMQFYQISIFLKLIAITNIVVFAYRIFRSKLFQEYLFYSNIVSSGFIILAISSFENIYSKTFIYFICAEMIFKNLLCLFGERCFLRNKTFNQTCEDIFRVPNDLLTKFYLGTILIFVCYMPIGVHFAFKVELLYKLLFSNLYMESFFIVLYSFISFGYFWRFMEYVIFSIKTKDSVSISVLEILTLLFCIILPFINVIQ